LGYRTVKTTRRTRNRNSVKAKLRLKERKNDTFYLNNKNNKIIMIISDSTPCTFTVEWKISVIWTVVLSVWEM
jgi:hypothetical protein